MTNILIVDMDRTYCDNLYKEFMKNESINNIYSCSNGDEAINIISNNKVDFIIMDIILQDKDGFDILEFIYKIKKSQNIGILIVSVFNDEKYIKKAFSLGTDYYILKPTTFDVIIKKSLEIIQNRMKKSTILKIHKEYSKNDMIYLYIGRFLSHLGVPTNLCGYRYLKTLVFLAICENELLTSYTKKLYPKGAECFSTTPERVERSIRHAIKRAWNKNPSLMKENLSKYGIKKKPTASMVISLMAENYSLQNDI